MCAKRTGKESGTIRALFKSFAAMAALVIGSSVAVSTQSSGRADGLRFVPDVEAQFLALADRRADALGFHIGNSPNPSHCKHYQAITRVNGADGTPFFLMSRSGNFPAGIPVDVCDDSPGETGNGHLIIFRMGSRDKNGERLRSNRLARGTHLDSTVPPAEDVATVYYTVVGGDPNDPDPAKRPGLVAGDGPAGTVLHRVYQHPGGMQLVGNVLALAVETPRNPLLRCLGACALGPNPQACMQQCQADFGDYEVAPNPTLIMFFDVSDPESPRFLSQFAPHHPEGDPFQGAGVVAVTPLPAAPGENFERYLMAITGGASDVVHFFRSNIGDLASPNLSWEFVDKAFPSEEGSQTLTFLRQGDMNGPLYMAAVRGSGIPGIIPGVGGPDEDKLDLYDVICEDPYCRPVASEFGVTMPDSFGWRRLFTFPNTGGDRLANGAAASGYYISPSGELILYVTEHDNDGPSGTVKAGEWRHRDVVRPGSPTLFPTASVNGPYEVDEGGSVMMSGSAQPPVTKPFIQLFHNTNLSGFNLISDYEDRLTDDFDNLFGFELQIITNPGNPPSISIFHHADKARSLNWFAPPGCTIRATDFGDGTSSDQPETLTLPTDGTPRSFADLTQILSDGTTSDINQEIDAVEFLDDCETYRNTPFQLRWDMDANGTFETAGSPVTFGAAAIDGPSVVNIPAQAIHPSGGPSGQAVAMVTVRNVAPAISPLALTDPAGNAVNSAVPFILTGMPVSASASFADPGVLDRQTATINWGDGTVEAQGSFVSFNEAFGDGTGAAADVHAYTTGGTYTLSLSVADDDGGSDVESVTLRVLTPEQAVMEIIDLLDAVIAGTPPGKLRKDLEKARKSLAGNPNGNNGALEKIRNGNIQAAIAHIDQAIRALQDAQTGGSDVAALIALLEQVKASLLSA